MPYRLIADRDAARQAVEELVATGKALGLDFETVGDPEKAADRKRPALDIVSAVPRLMQLATDDRVVVVDLDAIGGLRVLADLLAGLKAVAHNAAFETNILVRHGVRAIVDCTMVAQQLVTGRVDGLAAVTQQYLGLVVEKRLQKADWAGVLTDEHVRYAALDAWLTLKLWHILIERVREQGSDGVYKITRRVQPVVADMRLAGMPFDREAHARLTAELEGEVQRLQPPLVEALGGKNPRSVRDLGTWLTEALGGPESQAFAKWPKTGSGLLATGEDELKDNLHLLPDEPARVVRELLVPWREAAKLAGSYGLEYGRHVHPVTGRVHGDFKLSATAAGRMSCSNPNVQQVPRERRFRELFRAPAGRKLVIADYSMAELRVAAMLAGEEKMLGMFQRGEDVHRLTAAALLGKPADEVTKDERQLAKAVNFGLLFGQQARGLQAYAAAKYGVELTLEDAERHRRAWFDTYPGFRRWHAEHGAKTKRDLEVRTVCGRVRRWTSRAYREPGSYSLTEALNTPVQGSAAEALLCALGRLSRALSEGGIDALIINATHDEIVLEASDANADQAKDVLERSMVAGFTDVFSDAAVNGLVECHVGQSWADK